MWTGSQLCQRHMALCYTVVETNHRSPAHSSKRAVLRTACGGEIKATQLQPPSALLVSSLWSLASRLWPPVRNGAITRRTAGNAALSIISIAHGVAVRALPRHQAASTVQYSARCTTGCVCSRWPSLVQQWRALVDAGRHGGLFVCFRTDGRTRV